MSDTTSVGIHGIGVYLPEDIRKNDWWPQHVVDKWRQGNKQHLDHAARPEETKDIDGERLIRDAMEALFDDPFRGAVERRVSATGMASSEMEIRAAKEAIAKAGIPLEEIGFLLCHSAVPDYYGVANACIVHEQLGLRRYCFTLTTDAFCNSFIQQLAIGEKIVKGGMAKYGLLIQSANLNRLSEQGDPVSPWMGEGATAVVLGPVAQGRGIIGHTHITDGKLYGAVLGGSPDREWYNGTVRMFVGNKVRAHTQFLHLCTFAKELLDNACERTGVSKSEIAHWFTHQPNTWLPQVSQKFVGVPEAKTMNTFAWTGNLVGANIPIALAAAEREGSLASDHIVAMFAGASGVTAGCVLLRWGN